MGGYKVNIKEYKISYIVTKNQTIKELMPEIAKFYNQMCEYHNKKITDINHIANYIKSKSGIALVKADKDYIKEQLIKDK